MSLLGQVDELEVAGERPRDLLRPVDRPRCHEAPRGSLVFRFARDDHRAAEVFDVLEQAGAAILRQHLAEHVSD